MTLDPWLAEAARSLERPELALTAEQQSAILDLARVAAHAVARPAAPLTTFLAGYVLGARGGLAELAELVAGLSDAAERHAAAADGG
jgi:hypothetical protein